MSIESMNDETQKPDSLPEVPPQGSAEPLKPINATDTKKVDPFATVLTPTGDKAIDQAIKGQTSGDTTARVIRQAEEIASSENPTQVIQGIVNRKLGGIPKK
ncbi:MAG: hypothetical protein HY044_04545 [Candidatus Woesebacteria bacterium]|nr:MAG: hypothetical protein HY044_04545 [Candidatus Woesebacteria bacterium]